MGNPIEGSYDKMIHRYGGRIIGVEKGEVRLPDGKLYDVKRYEITRREYIKGREKYEKRADMAM